MKLINWQFCGNPNEINDVILKGGDYNWEGLVDASQIINILYSASLRNYMVFWVRKEKDERDLISRQDALDAFNHNLTVTGRENANEVRSYIKETMDKIKALPSADRPTEWIPVSERLPKCEQEVLICTEKKLVGRDAYIDSIVTPAIYEDGTMLEVESMWSWYDMDFDEWDDAEDCGIIPMGWFENRHFNHDEVYNSPVDRKVVAWMPLPEPYREDGE